MKCNEIKHYMELFIDSELDAKTTLEISEHLAVCADCNKRFVLEQKLDNRFVSMFALQKNAVNQKKYIDKAWSKTISAINDQERMSFKPVLNIRYLVPAFATIAAILFVVIASYLKDVELVSAANHCHIEYVTNKISPMIETHIPEEIEKYFSSKLDFSVALFTDNVFGNETKLMGARLCYLKGTAVAYVMYKHHKFPLSIFYIDKKDLEDFPKAKKILDKTGYLERSNSEAGNFVAMSSSDTVVCAVSQLDLQSLREFVRDSKIKIGSSQ